MLTTLVTWIWALIGSRPKIKSASGRQSVAYSGFVIPSTGKLWFNKPGWFAYETVIASIRDFLANNPLEEGVKYYSKRPYISPKVGRRAAHQASCRVK